MKIDLVYKEMLDFQALLFEDIRSARDFGKSHKSQFSLRTLYRTSAAHIEGVIYQLRLVCLAALDDIPNIYNASEIIILNDINLKLNNKGEIVEQDSYQNLKSNILFLFKSFAKLQNIEFQPNTSDHKWESLGKFIELRNSLMHPKSISDFEMNEYKNNISVEAVKWFQENLDRLYRECERADAATGT